MVILKWVNQDVPVCVMACSPWWQVLSQVSSPAASDRKCHILYSACSCEPGGKFPPHGLGLSAVLHFTAFTAWPVVYNSYMHVRSVQQHLPFHSSGLTSHLMDHWSVSTVKISNYFLERISKLWQWWGVWGFAVENITEFELKWAEKEVCDSRTESWRWWHIDEWGWHRVTDNPAQAADDRMVNLTAWCPVFTKMYSLECDHTECSNHYALDNLSDIWRSGEWPIQWTQSVVITLPKKGNLQQCQNYRTISLISH